MCFLCCGGRVKSRPHTHLDQAQEKVVGLVFPQLPCTIIYYSGMCIFCAILLCLVLPWPTLPCPALSCLTICYTDTGIYWFCRSGPLSHPVLPHLTTVCPTLFCLSFLFIYTYFLSCPEVLRPVLLLQYPTLCCPVLLCLRFPPLSVPICPVCLACSDTLYPVLSFFIPSFLPSLLFSFVLFFFLLLWISSIINSYLL